MKCFHLIMGCRRYEFRIESNGIVTISFFDGSWCRTTRERTTEQARQEWSRLVRRGWERF